jgi:thiol-disulfide isomerase/thioredoxin
MDAVLGRRSAMSLGIAASASVAFPARGGLPRFDGAAGRRSSAWQRARLLSEDGSPAPISSLPRPLTLMVLWAGWCAACRAELQLLPALSPRLGADAEIVLVSRPEDAERDFPLARRARTGLRLLRFAPDTPPDLLADAFGQDGGSFMVPQVVAVSGTPRRVVWSHVGPLDWSDPAVVERFRELVSP